MVLLREDATAVALPEAALQIREDMEIVMVRARYGGKTEKVDAANRGGIFSTRLEDVIAAIKKAQQRAAGPSRRHRLVSKW